MPGLKTTDDNRTVADVMLSELAGSKSDEIPLTDLVAAVVRAGIEVTYDAVRKRTSRDKRFARRTAADGAVMVRLAATPEPEQQPLSGPTSADEIRALREEVARLQGLREEVELLIDTVSDLRALLAKRVSNRPAVTPMEIRDAAVRVANGNPAPSHAVRLQVGRPAKNWARDVRQAVKAGVVEFDPDARTITPRYRNGGAPR